jgi:hypothetical protein
MEQRSDNHPHVALASSSEGPADDRTSSDDQDDHKPFASPASGGGPDKPFASPTATSPVAASPATAAAASLVAAHGAGDPERRCPNVDISTRDELAKLLLHALSQIAVFRKVGLDAALVELEKAVLSPEDEREVKGLVGMALLRARIDKAANKKGGWSSVANVFNRDQLVSKVEKKARELQTSGDAIDVVTERLAPAFIRHYDIARHHHCTYSFDDRTLADLERHATSCRWRALRCPNPGCEAYMSAHEMGAHDEVCGYKLLPCVRGCAAHIARQSMEEHVTSECARRPVICPFQHVGCDVACTHGELAEHLAASTTQHMLLVLASLFKQQETVNGFAAQLLDARTRAHAAESDAAESKRDVAALSKQFISLQKAQAAAHKRADSHDGAIKKVEAALARLESAHGATDKELKASLGKLAADQLKMKGTVDTLVEAAGGK